MNTAVLELLAKRRDRTIAVLLSVKERECDSHLPEPAKRILRKAILDQINDLHALMVDIVHTLDSDDVVLNDLYLQKLDEVHAAVVRQPVANGRF